MENRQETSIPFVYCDRSPEMKLISYSDIRFETGIDLNDEEDSQTEYAA